MVRYQSFYIYIINIITYLFSDGNEIYFQHNKWRRQGLVLDFTALVKYIT